MYNASSMQFHYINTMQQTHQSKVAKIKFQFIFFLLLAYYQFSVNFLAMLSILYFAQFRIKQSPFKEKRKMVYAKPTIICSLKAVMQQLECYNKQSNNINFIWLLHYHLKCNEAVCKNARDLRLLFLHSIKLMLG